MHLSIASLNSGSNGNCYYIGNDQDAVLIDAGISCREIHKRMSRLGLPLSRVRAIFVSHEHGDHISGVEVLSARHNIPVYITQPTLANSRLRVKTEMLNFYTSYGELCFGDLVVSAFPKYHDACDPHSFVIHTANTKVGVFTDIGKACNELIKRFKQCDAAFLEANYDETMLIEGRYPWHLKNRIRGGMGHLSNNQALQVLIDHRPSALSQLLLSHLSRENNRPELVEKLFRTQARSTKIAIASRDHETPVYMIRSSGSIKVNAGVPRQLCFEF